MDLAGLKELISKHVTEIIYEDSDTEDMLEYSYNPITNTIHIYPYSIRIGREKLSLLRGLGGKLSKGIYKHRSIIDQPEVEDQINLHMGGAMQQLTAILMVNLYGIELSKGEQLEVFNQLYLHMMGLSKTVVWHESNS